LVLAQPIVLRWHNFANVSCAQRDNIRCRVLADPHERSPAVTQCLRIRLPPRAGEKGACRVSVQAQKRNQKRQKGRKPDPAQDFASESNFLALPRAVGTGARTICFLEARLVPGKAMPAHDRARKPLSPCQNKTDYYAAKGGSSEF
jgi:hypothetical protein